MISRIETHAHSMFSNIRLIDSTNQPKDLILTAHKLGLKGICLTDHETLSGAVEWLNLEKKLKKEEKIPEDFKCGIGNEIYLTETRQEGQKYYHYILIAKDTIGFRQLAELSSNSWYHSYFDKGMERVPTLKSELAEIVKRDPGHLIATTSCIGGELASLVFKYLDEKKNGEIYTNKIYEEIEAFINFNIKLFNDDFYIEVAPSMNADQIRFNKVAAKIANHYGVKMIYGTDAHYLSKDARFVHKAYLNSKDGERETDLYYEFAHLMSNEEAADYFRDYYTEEQFVEMCDNSMSIYNKIDSYDIFHTPIIPQVQVKDYNNDNVKEFLTIVNNFSIDVPTLKKLFTSPLAQERYWVNQCFEALKKKSLIKKEYLLRLETEADIIQTVGDKLNNCLFEYFNTFQSLIELFWDCGSIVGPGRGSSVCFLSNYLLGITQLDPLSWGLMEWRFLNKDRLELPDIDIDLSPTKRPLILKKIREQRGETRVIQVATFGTESTKSAILAACRGYRSNECPDGIDVDEAQYISSLIPQERGFIWPLNDVINGNPDKDRNPIQLFIDEINKYPGLLDIMLGIEGLVNKRSQHASGVILYNNDPWVTSALMKSPNGDLITQFSLEDEEELGGTKFDFLVTAICDKIINTITLLQKDGFFDSTMSLKSIYDNYFHPSKIDLTESKLWDTLAEGNVLSLFQFDSDVGCQAIKLIKPRNPYELMMANALIRLTGEKGKERPMDRYVRLKNDISQWYDECKDCGLTSDEISILEPYYLPVNGCPTTQEKLMLLCMEPKLANFSLKDANTARKICAKFFGV